jgi:hypothetical protein
MKGGAVSKRKFLLLDHELIDGDAFGAATGGATRLLIFIMRRFNGRNNGDIPCGIREAAKFLHCGKSTAARFFEELEGLKLIEPTRRGHFEVKQGEMKNVATRWRVTFLENARVQSREQIGTTDAEAA